MFLSNRINPVRSFSTRLTLWYGMTFLVLLLASMLGVILAIGSILDARMEEELEEDIEELQELYREQGFGKVIEDLESEMKGNEPNSFFLRLFNDKGEMLLASDLESWSFLQPVNTLLDKQSDDEPLIEVVDHPALEHISLVVFGEIGPGIYLQLGETMEEKDEVMAVIQIASIIIFCVVIPLASCICWLMAKRASAGIKEVSSAAVDIKNGKLDRRAAVASSGDEIAELAETFNAMAERIRSLIAEMREMTDNIAHDLRSPLARIRAISEVTISNAGNIEDYRSAVTDTLEECDRLLQMINMTLDVAEAEAGVGNEHKESINISMLAEEACDLFAPLAEEKGIQLQVAINRDLVVFGNKHNLQRMLANLIDNALKYTPEGGLVSIDLNRQDDGIVIRVKDTGIGIPEADLPRVFERFYRCDHSRSQDGCGLGLSFSRAVARAHGGDITLQSVINKQTIFTVLLPTT